MLLAWIPDRAVLLFAWQVFESILKHGLMACTEQDVGVLRDRCRDPAVSVQKQALHSITELLLVRHRAPCTQGLPRAQAGQG